ncbi:MAG: hypothetical protein A3F11_03580 [Gammaproteobacteria bacterium RIFCSPHIGHO2_12_FULL_37_14]|nr:MAG: hypothetical protein A3F11_03580 [Gammaproteobacteria bacterium RIFCSPHIGHO2_12_FULL_37_14]
MKVLIVAHPDDEIIWFDPLYFNLILITFCERHDRIRVGRNRLNAILQHPLKDKICMLNIPESGFWKNKTKVSEYTKTAEQLTEMLFQLKNSFQISEIYTHNSVGEYGHDDHILVHQCVIKVFNGLSNCNIYCPTKYMKEDDLRSHQTIKNKMEINFYNKVKNIYLENNCWTWNLNSEPRAYEEYYQVSSI